MYKRQVNTYERHEVVLGLHKLIVQEYNFQNIKDYLERFVMRFEEDSWEKLAGRIGHLGKRVFGDFTEGPET